MEVALTEDTTERMQAALLAGELDIAILGTAEETPPPGAAFQTVIDVPLVAAVAPGDPVLDRVDGTSVPLADLRDRPLICLPRGTGVRTALERGCAQAGFRPRVAFEAAAPHVLSQLAARGLGIAVLPAGENESPSTDAFAPCGSSGPRCVPASRSPGRPAALRALRPAFSSTAYAKLSPSPRVLDCLRP